MSQGRLARNLTDAIPLDNGEKIIPGSVRPDGTVRKERRVRAGYTPQEEQQVYQSRGTIAKQNVPTCPGLDEADIAALKQQAGKGKKPSGPKPDNQPPKPKPAPQPSSQAKAPSKSAAAAAPAPAAPAPPAEPEDPKAALEKQIRNLNKKIRQCTDLQEKQKSGAALDKDQLEKLGKAESWQEEVRGLEAQLAQLAV